MQVSSVWQSLLLPFFHGSLFLFARTLRDRMRWLFVCSCATTSRQEEGLVRTALNNFGVIESGVGMVNSTWWLMMQASLRY